MGQKISADIDLGIGRTGIFVNKGDLVWIAVSALFQEVMADVVIIQNMAGVYYPDIGVNTIGQWDNHEGYKIKTANDITLNISGWTDPSRELTLNTGWNLIPVLSECDVQVDKLFYDASETVVLVKIIYMVLKIIKH